MNKSEIAEQIRQTEEKLANLRKELEKPEYPTLADAKPGDMLENGCVVVEKFPSVMMALIAAPKSTSCHIPWNRKFNGVFNNLEREGFNRSQWFIPTVEQLKLAYKNCGGYFAATWYWSSSEASSTDSWRINFFDGVQKIGCKTKIHYARTFSLVDY